MSAETLPSMNDNHTPGEPQVNACFRFVSQKNMLGFCVRGVILIGLLPILIPVGVIYEGRRAYRDYKKRRILRLSRRPPKMRKLHETKKEALSRMPAIFKRKKPVTPIPPQTVTAALLPSEILTEIFSYLGPSKVDRWYFKNCWGKPRVDNPRHPLPPCEQHRRYALRPLAYVCKSWHMTANALLYEHVDIFDIDELRLFVWTLENAPRLACVVRSFTHLTTRLVEPHVRDETIPEYGRCMRKLCVEGLLPPKAELNIGTDSSLFTSEILPYLGKARVIDMEIATDMFDHTLAQCVNDSLSFRFVQTLTMRAAVWPDLQPPFASMFPQLTTLRLFKGRIDSCNSNTPDVGYFRLPKLQRLEIYEVILETRGIRTVQALLDLYSPTLQYLVIMDMDSKADYYHPDHGFLNERGFAEAKIPIINLSGCTALKSVALGYFWVMGTNGGLDTCWHETFKLPPSLEELEYRMHFKGEGFPKGGEYKLMEGSRKRDGEPRNPAYRRLKCLPNLKMFRYIALEAFLVCNDGSRSPVENTVKNLAADDVEVEILVVSCNCAHCEFLRQKHWSGYGDAECSYSVWNYYDL